MRPRLLETAARQTQQNEPEQGRVYTLSNETTNKVIIYKRATDGSLTYQSSVSTGGSGTGIGLGSQGAIVMTDDGTMVLSGKSGK